MTASELASALHARRTGKGTWVALCPAHGDHTPSLHIAEGRKRPIVLRCMSQGCSTKAILEAIGLSWEAVMGPGEVTPEMRGRMRQERRIAELQRRRVWFLLAWAADAPSNRRYWWKCVQNCDAEIQELSDKLNPDGVKIRGHPWTALAGCRKAKSDVRSRPSRAPVTSLSRPCRVPIRVAA